MAREPTNSVDLALSELENEPLPTHTRDHPPPEDEIEVDYEGDTPETAEKPASEPEKREIDADEGIDTLRARLQASDLARRQAEDRANAAERARADAAGNTQEANVSFLTSALDSVRQGMGILEANLAQAYAEQDFAAAAKIQTELARAAQREGQIDAGLEQLKAMPRDQPRAMPREQDQVEAVASQLTPNAAAWVRQHPDYITDPQKNARLMSAHYDAMANGLVGDSPEYIRYVEQHVGLGGQRAGANGDGRRDPPVERRDPVAERRTAPPAAPVSRQGASQSNPQRVTLTREEREMARETFPDELAKDPTGRKSEQAYARNKLILQREGRMKVN
jgi:hypothetical protein